MRVLTVMVSPPRVLVADDQPLLRWALGRMLESLGAAAVFASTYQDACERLAGDEFAVVVAASPLDGRNVAGVLSEFERLRPGARLVVLCSGDHCEQMLRDIPRATLFCKPFPLSELAAVIGPVLAHHATA